MGVIEFRLDEKMTEATGFILGVYPDFVSSPTHASDIASHAWQLRYVGEVFSCVFVL